MVISKQLIKKPQKRRVCEKCRQVISGSQLRLYGRADSLDKPYVIYVHPTCEVDITVDE